MRFLYLIIYSICYVFSMLPLKIHYIISDIILFPLLYYIIGYRRKIVRKNLTECFPQKNQKEITAIEKKFYHWFSDFLVETLKLFSISHEEIMKRMTFEGIDEMEQRLLNENKHFIFVYLGHYGNWEWITTLKYWLSDGIHTAQIYHPLYNKLSDELFLKLRNRAGGECIPMKITMKRIIELKREDKRTAIGFIADQAPKWNSMHHWTHFLNHQTSFFIGAEKIGKKVDALFYYADISRPRRGYYHCHFKLMSPQAINEPDFNLTDQYARMLENSIQDHPEYWLWSHKRWKRTYEQWLQRQEENNEKQETKHT